MISNNCEKCGKELNFFTRRGSLINDRLNIHYDSLCSECHSLIKHGISSIEQMYNYIINKLKEHQEDNMSSVDIDTLILLSIDAIYNFEPDYNKKDSSIYKTFINRKEMTDNPVEDIAIIVENIIDYGFSINKKNAQIIDFRSYFYRSILFVNPIGLNANDAVPQTFCSVFFTSKGLVACNIETKEIYTAFFDKDQIIKYALISENNVSEFVFDNFYLSGNIDKNVILSTNDKNVVEGLEKTIAKFNTVTQRQIDRNRHDFLSTVTDHLFKDLKRLQPECDLIDFPIEFIILLLIKNTKDLDSVENLDCAQLIEFSSEILINHFNNNLIDNGINDNMSSLNEYFRSHCLFVDQLKATYENNINQTVWAFFTTKGYLVSFSSQKHVLFEFNNDYPNDLYYPCNDMIYKGQRFLQIPKNAHIVDNSKFKTLDGLILYSDDFEKIQNISKFFRLNNTFYIMDRYVDVKSEIYQNRAKLMDVKRISERLFSDFSYLPFCQYDEWAAISDKIKEDDFLLCQLIEEKTGNRNRYSSKNTTYTLRIIDAFTRLSKELNECLKLNDLSLSKAILWDFFNESLVDIMAGEWIRIAGDFVKDSDSLESAFSKYFNMADIETDKSYYLGLFVYYLMSKMVLPFNDFLENYERCLPVYLKYNQPVENVIDNEEMAEILDDPQDQAPQQKPDEAETDTPQDPETAEVNSEVETSATDETEAVEETEEAETVEKAVETETTESEEIDQDKAIAAVADEQESDDDQPIDSEEENAKDEQSSFEQIGIEALMHQENILKETNNEE